jgi:4-amino-4-deoxy-L-arabinose transferase-like glycosyltransferase
MPVSRSLYTATISAVLIVCSPVFVLYGGQVMTDVPSVLILGIALVIHLHGVKEKQTLAHFDRGSLNGSRSESSRDDWILCAVVSACAACLRLETAKDVNY